MPTIILASQSPRRQELLRRIGLRDFTVLVPHASERWDPSLSPAEGVAAISRAKAAAAAALCGPSDILIAADTMVFLKNRRLGKPADESEAFAMLSALSGRTHRVCTGVTLCQGDRIETRAGSTAVAFRPLLEREIRAYIRTGDPMDKAGAYGVQGRAALFVREIHGDYFNVMGLPLHLLGRMLLDFGVDLFGEEVGR